MPYSHQGSDLENEIILAKIVATPSLDVATTLNPELRFRDGTMLCYFRGPPCTYIV